MKIETIVVGCMEENCYILECDGKCLVIDPGDEYSKIKEKISSKELLAVLITHHHHDHIGALNDLLQDYEVPVCRKRNLKEKIYTIGPFRFQCIYTPGHTSDSVTFYFEEEKIMFTGDFVFRGTVGRCDFPTGNIEEMDQSILRLKQYSKDVILYSGHGDPTTLEQECRTNPYF